MRDHLSKRNQTVYYGSDSLALLAPRIWKPNQSMDNQKMSM